jgi:2'-5' RNA ligase
MFVALVPPDEAVEHLDEFLAPRREAGEFRWATTEQFHVTLAFLASVQDRHLDELVERLGRAAARRTAFAARVTGGGAFPGVARARVIWAGLGLTAAGATELGRPVDVSRWVRLLDTYDGPPWTADRVALIESHLGEGPRGRPRYEVVEEFVLPG